MNGPASPLERPSRRVKAVVLGAAAVTLLALALAAPPAASNAGGAPISAATGGCTCHAGTASGDASVTLTGTPATFEPGVNYTLTLEVSGPSPLPAIAQNAGGFALLASAGTLAPTDDTTQVVQGGLTQTAAGNDQRSWTFEWTAPVERAAVTFEFAGNAVNGNNVNDQLDAWALGTLTVEPAPAPPSPAPATPPEGEGEDGGEEETPSLGFAIVVAAAGLVALLRRR